jgi:hypothetical protein
VEQDFCILECLSQISKAALRLEKLVFKTNKLVPYKDDERDLCFFHGLHRTMRDYSDGSRAVWSELSTSRTEIYILSRFFKSFYII